MANPPDKHATKIPVKRLTSRSDFLKLRNGRRYRSRLFTVQNRKSDTQDTDNACRVGYTVTTKTGNAVERNRIKRRLRAAVQLVFPSHARPNTDYAIIAKRTCLNADFTAIASELHRALDHFAVNKAKGSKQASTV